MTNRQYTEDERELDFDANQLELPLDERFRRAEQYALDLEPEAEAQKLRRLTRLLNS